MATAKQSTDVEKQAESVKEVAASRTEMEVLAREGEKISEEVVEKAEEKSVQKCKDEQVEAKSAEADCSKTEEPSDLSGGSTSGDKLESRCYTLVVETAEVAEDTSLLAYLEEMEARINKAREVIANNDKHLAELSEYFKEARLNLGLDPAPDEE